ncbi:hypothetical protein MMC25_000803 [Agyrium rufum]|nr:hypothetical protein [Agyrium rufum]
MPLTKVAEGVDEKPTATLRRWLSTQTILSTDIFTDANPDGRSILVNDRPTHDTESFHSIGKGMCAEIFAEPHTTFKTLKRACTPLNGQLWNDFIEHHKISIAIHNAFFYQGHLKLSVPRVFEYYTRDDEEWWDGNRRYWATPSLKEATDLLEMERIHALPKTVRDALIERYCPEDAREAAQCILEYVGYTTLSPEERKFPLRNFEADLSIVDELLDESEKAHHAKAMAVALALMHWSARVDATDIEFVLGSPPPLLSSSSIYSSASHDSPFSLAELEKLTFRASSSLTKRCNQKPAHLWLLDFNQVGFITMGTEGVEKAVRAFWQNDPYYPQLREFGHRDRGLWELFVQTYLDESKKIGEKEERRLGLAKRFVDRVEEEGIMRREGVEFTRPPMGGPPRGRGGAGKVSDRVRSGRGIVIPELDG